MAITAVALTITVIVNFPKDLSGVEYANLHCVKLLYDQTLECTVYNKTQLLISEYLQYIVSCMHITDTFGGQRFSDAQGQHLDSP